MFHGFFYLSPHLPEKMAKYLSEISEWYFDAVNKGHRFSTFNVTVSDERSANKKKNNVKILACSIQRAPSVQAIL